MPPSPTIHSLFWEDVDPAVHAGRPAVSQELFDRCNIVVMTEGEFAAVEATLKAIATSIPHKGFADVEWHRTRWTEAHLIEQCGFVRTDDPTILVVSVGERFAVKYAYLPVEEESPEMRALCEYVFDDIGGVREGLDPEGGLRGQSIVHRRGNKAMNEGSTMLMYGSWDCWDCHGGGAKVKGVTQPRVYNPQGKIDEQLATLLYRHTDSLNALERQLVPAYGAHRDALADEIDPQGLHRVSPGSTAFSASLTASYVISPHNDSGLACETIAFVNRNGPLPQNHEWLFALGGHVHALPSRRGCGVVLFIKGTGLYHGTLPTSSREPTYLHGSHGSALVTKQRMVDGLRRQAARGESTPQDLSSARLFQPSATGRPPPSTPRGRGGARERFDFELW